MVEFIFTTCSSRKNHGNVSVYHVELTIPYANSVLVPDVFRVEFFTTELHGIFVYGSRTVIPCLFRVFSVFNFMSRNYTELSCTTCTRRHRIGSVCFPCLIVYRGTARNSRVMSVAR